MVLSLPSSRKNTSIVILLVIPTLIVGTIPVTAHAQSALIDVSAVSFEETVIIEINNTSGHNISAFRIWLEGDDASFASFKTEYGWIGQKNQQGVIAFTPSGGGDVGTSKSIKFGIKADVQSPVISWKILDIRNAELGLDRVIPVPLSVVDPPVVDPPVVDVVTPPPPPIETPIDEDIPNISDKSVFRIIPERPNVGSTIRVTGQGFGSTIDLGFYINSQEIGKFQTDENGYFMTTMKIPNEQEEGRVDFAIRDNEEGELTKSLRLEIVKDRIVEPADIQLTIYGVPDIAHRGGMLEVHGTGTPSSAIAVEVVDPDHKVVNSRTAEINSRGEWSLDPPILINFDAPFGEYHIAITDGEQIIQEYWNVQTDKKIIITPSSIQYREGQTMNVILIASTDKPLVISIENPQGSEILSDTITTNGTGDASFTYEFQSTDEDGTYTIIATQEKDIEFMFVGLGQPPVVPIKFEPDKFHYQVGETVMITLRGDASSTVKLLVLSPNGLVVGNEETITLKSDGRGTHSISTKQFSTGVYTAVISKDGKDESHEFAVDLQKDTDVLQINTAKIRYEPGELIQILGNTGSNSKDGTTGTANVLLTLTMLDPDGNTIRSVESYSDKDRNIADGTFRVPSDAKMGVWKIKATSTTKFAETEFTVQIEAEGMTITISKSDSPQTEDLINIDIKNIKKPITFTITSSDGTVIEEPQTRPVINERVYIPYITRDLLIGETYTITVTDTADTTVTAQYIHE